MFRAAKSRAFLTGLIATGLLCAGWAWRAGSRPGESASRSAANMRFQRYGSYTLWWDGIPEDVRNQAVHVASGSNIHPADYVGPEACRKCHKEQYESWSKHSHRWMNALIENSPVKGKFDGQTIAYLGGHVTFAHEGDEYVMRLDRGDVHREYVVTQTIGSRFFQYYVGRQRRGPEPKDHPLYHDDHVLPLGYWIDRDEWVPIVHVHPESPEWQRHDPFARRRDWPVRDFSDYAGRAWDMYRSQCNFCHTTFAIGDMFVRNLERIGQHVPVRLDVSLPEYVRSARPQLWPGEKEPYALSDEEFATILKTFRNLDAPTHAVTLGISCEACHLGARQHAEGKLLRPQFFPRGPEVAVVSEQRRHDTGRTQQNVNWACGRCHSGGRPQFAAGMATWNSTEYTDAVKGACYSELTCVRCHNPHETLGSGWSRTPLEDDAICLSCHQHLAPDSARKAHTHHPLESEGSRCMNCHMPRINEGLQEVVRTHTIFSPTNAAMIEANQPNACNLCHVDRSIQWTLTHLEKWYAVGYSDFLISLNYERDVPVALGWLHSDKEAVRLVAADCLTRAGAEWALDELLDALDDPYLLNRQFARIGLERMLDIRLSDFGYRFYMTPEERRAPIESLRQNLVRDVTQKPGTSPPPDRSDPAPVVDLPGN